MRKNIRFKNITVELENDALELYLVCRDLLNSEAFFFDGEHNMFEGYYLDYIKDTIAFHFTGDKYIIEQVSFDGRFEGVGTFPVEFSPNLTISGNPEIVYVYAKVAAYE